MQIQKLRIDLQFFAEDNDVTTAKDVDFGAIFTESEDSGESEPQEDINTDGEPSDKGDENQDLANQEPDVEQQEETPIPNEVWKKARLKAEREADDRIKKMQEEFNNNFADDEYIGKENPYNGKIIKTKADQQEYLEAYSRDALKSNGLDENFIQKMIDNNPVIREAKALKEQIMAERGQEQLNKELGLITELNPDIKTLEDFRKLPNIEELDHLILNRGMSLSEAYKLANYNELIAKQKAVAKQQAINLAKGKSHLVSTDGSSGEEISVPKDVMEMYKAINPDISTTEIREHYIKSQKQKARN